MPQVQVIEPVNAIYRYAPPKLRVCAYARVSSDSADQLNSFSVQMEHYTSLIAGNDEWELVTFMPMRASPEPGRISGRNSSGCFPTAERAKSTASL